jgi:hypothetical protein
MPLTPSAEAAIERLAKLTVERGWDPGRVMQNLADSAQLLASLSPEMRREVIAELRRRLGDGS